LDCSVKKIPFSFLFSSPFFIFSPLKLLSFTPPLTHCLVLTCLAASLCHFITSSCCFILLFHHLVVFCIVHCLMLFHSLMPSCCALPCYLAISISLRFKYLLTPTFVAR
jgi:hypothetical protein